MTSNNQKTTSTVNNAPAGNDNATAVLERGPQLIHAVMRAYPVIESITTFSHLNDIHNLAHTSPALNASISASGVLGHSRNWPTCPGDMPCYGCTTPLCAQCCKWKTFHCNKQPVPLSHRLCSHRVTRVMNDPAGGAYTRQHLCSICVEKSEEELMEACRRMALETLERVTNGLESLAVCQQCAPKSSEHNSVIQTAWYWA